ncbi:MAG: ZIP family metal transporter [Ruminococcus sp.]|nr:ZIP family metal transporter [Ruminococcus sp.]
MFELIKGISVPFIGTALGAGCVFVMKDALGVTAQRILAGFAAGVMTAASVWSLLLPAIEQSRLLFVPAAGFGAGVLLMLIIDMLIPHMSTGQGLSKNTMLMLAVTLHNIPEGMAVGAVYAGLLYGGEGVTAAGAFALALGIAVQNFPEGAIISMPLKAEGMGRGRAFLAGVLSGAAEPAGAVLTILAASLIIPAMPCFLSFAAGAMMYVVAQELIPEMSAGESGASGKLSFSAGFAAMMILDVALG